MIKNNITQLRILSFIYSYIQQRIIKHLLCFLGNKDKKMIKYNLYYQKSLLYKNGSQIGLLKC